MRLIWVLGGSVCLSGEAIVDWLGVDGKGESAFGSAASTSLVGTLVVSVVHGEIR